MDVKEAVKMAMEYFADIFEEEKPKNIGLEEVEFIESESFWKITIGFSRPWDEPQQGLLSAMQSQNPTRQYKVITVDNESEEIKSIMIRERKSA